VKQIKTLGQDYVCCWFDGVISSRVSSQKWDFSHHLLTLNLFQTCVNFSLLLNTKEGILKNVVTKQLMNPTGFNSFFFFCPYYGNQWGPSTVWFPIFLKISSFEFIQVWNNMRVSQWWLKFHFWVNYPFIARQACSQL